MPAKYLHELKEFSDLLRIIEEESGVLAYLVEKDYWLMHVLYGLQKQGFDFKLKGGTSLSKGYGIIERFSEDIDIYIKPPTELGINERSEKATHIEKRRQFYELLAQQIRIDGIVRIVRDHEFDDQKYRSGGIRLFYKSYTTPIEGIKEGILLEAGFDTVTPDKKLLISSWAYDRAIQSDAVQITDNRAINVSCYHPGYTFVEKLQTIATKYRKEQETVIENKNFMRQYYDIYCMLEEKRVKEFIGTEEYHVHKKKRFPAVDFEIPIAANEAFTLKNPEIRALFSKRYQSTSALYYKGQPSFEDILNRIHSYLGRL